MSTINIRIDEDTKLKVQTIIHSLGMNLSEAINIYLKQIIFKKGIPFDIKLPNRETLQAINELESGKGSTFNSVDELFEDLDN